MDFVRSKQVAKSLREIAEDFETSTAKHLLYADLKASNQHLKRLAAPLVAKSFTNGSVLAGSESGYLRWHGLRVCLGIKQSWLSEFDRDTAPPHTRRFLRTPDAEDLLDEEREPWRDSIEQTPYEAIEQNLRNEFDEESELAGRIEIDRTADELREWYVRQALAWSSTLLTLADRIDISHTESETTHDDQTVRTNPTSARGRFFDDNTIYIVEPSGRNLVFRGKRFDLSEKQIKILQCILDAGVSLSEGYIMEKCGLTGKKIRDQFRSNGKTNPAYDELFVREDGKRAIYGLMTYRHELIDHAID
ncbi:hypothetical protein LOC71_22125 [Rhodopirellula sp. JC740]|uniref:Uncharacterized protein n=1 Tax=Rhodopirellula halodulae TaxID=2894198 RepID=A0ABS8NQ76_9BACT|nr:hypothetical protein [Rhodopirellula sp. JC740]MCC9644983.1 hypothetical protein [Rhodopirellula sp. JC740]